MEACPGRGAERRPSDGAVVDGLRIDAMVTRIDVSGGALAGAGPTVVRVADATPATGFVRCDEADALDPLVAGSSSIVGLGTIRAWEGLPPTVRGSMCFTEKSAAHAEAFAEIVAADPLSERGVPVEDEGGGAPPAAVGTGTAWAASRWRASSRAELRLGPPDRLAR